MRYMEDLKDLLCSELEDYAEKGKKSGKMSTADIEVIDTVLNSVKNIYKIDKYKEETEGYSEDGHYMGEGRIYGTSYDDGMGGNYSRRGGSSYEDGSSYARGRRNARRDSRGRYSRDGGMGGSSYARGGRGGNQGGGNYSREGGYSRDEAKDYMMDQIEEMMEMAEKPAEKEALKRCMHALERA